MKVFNRTAFQEVENLSTEIEKTEYRLNAEVYKLFNLTQDEIALIEENV